MKRWDTLSDRFMEVYTARKVATSTVEAMRREWDAWGCWLKARRPRPKLEDVSHELITQYISGRGKFRAKATLEGKRKEKEGKREGKRGQNYFLRRDRSNGLCQNGVRL